MEESSVLKAPEQKEVNDNDDKENQNSNKQLPNLKNEDSYQIPVEQKPKEKHYQIEENDEGEEGEIKIDSSIRNIFIRKIFGILAIKYFLFYSIVIKIRLTTQIRREIMDNYDVAENVLYYSSETFGILFLLLFFFRQLFKIVPFNYFCFLVFSVCEIASFSVISTLYFFHIIYISLLLTSVASISIIIYSFFEKEEYNYFKLGLLVFLSQLLICWFIFVFYEFKSWYMLLTFFFIVLTGNFLVYDTLAIATKCGHSYSVNDYIFAILEIYIDLVKTILYLIKIGCQALSKKCIKKKYTKINN